MSFRLGEMLPSETMKWNGRRQTNWWNFRVHYGRSDEGRSRPEVKRLEFSIAASDLSVRRLIALGQCGGRWIPAESIKSMEVGFSFDTQIYIFSRVLSLFLLLSLSLTLTLIMIIIIIIRQIHLWDPSLPASALFPITNWNDGNPHRGLMKYEKKHETSSELVEKPSLPQTQFVIQ